LARNHIIIHSKTERRVIALWNVRIRIKLTVSLILTKISNVETSTETRQEVESTQDPSKRVHGSLDIQHQVPVRHSVHLRIPDVHCRERQKPRVADSGTSAKTSRAGIWSISILPDQSIYIRWGLLRLESSYMAILSLHHDIQVTPDRKNHPSVLS
jgi:hypothetical protein